MQKIYILWAIMSNGSREIWGCYESLGAVEVAKSWYLAQAFDEGISLSIQEHELRK